MAVLVNESTRVLVQGMTGQMGRSETRRMLECGTDVVAGVTPRRGGESVLGRPVYGTVAEAVARHSPNAAAVYVPAPAALAAVEETLAAGVPLILLATERIPLHDLMRMLALARVADARIVGPNSLGVISPGLGRLGGVGGDDPDAVFSPGPVGVISRSGGMGTELSWMLSGAGLGQSTFISTGSDRVMGSSFADLLPLFEADPKTRAVVLFGEPGGDHEERAAELIASAAVTKPVIALLAGWYVDRFPGVQFGHAGAMVHADAGTVAGKARALEQAGAVLARAPRELPVLVSEALGAHVSRAAP